MRRMFGLVGTCMLLFAGGCSAEPAVPEKSPLSGVLFINEFMASNKATVPDEHGDFADWVELYNSGDSELDLRGMFLTDDLARPMKWSFPDTTLPARSYVLVWCDAEYRQGAMHASFRLDADKGEQLGLYVTDGDHVFMIDTLSFGAQRSDTSRGRIPDGGAEWRYLSVPTPGTQNSTGASSLQGVLFINEFMASNQTVIADEAGDFDDWIELYNAGTERVALGGFALTDDLREEAKWEFPDTSIAAGGYLLVWADNEGSEGSLHANFNLGAAAGEQIGLYQKNGEHTLVVDSLSFGHQSPDTSYGRLPDGGTDWEFLPAPTPGSANRSGARKGDAPDR